MKMTKSEQELADALMIDNSSLDRFNETSMSLAEQIIRKNTTRTMLSNSSIKKSGTMVKKSSLNVSKFPSLSTFQEKRGSSRVSRPNSDLI
jgi:hypothetical protein